MTVVDFQHVVRRRRMVRRYCPDDVGPEVIERLLDNAIRAPNAGFSQGWSFLVLEERADVDRFWAATTPPERAEKPDTWLTGMQTAPVVIVPMSSKEAYLDRYAEPDKGWSDRCESRWPIPYWHVDTGMASLLILMTAVDEELGACFFGIPRSRIQALRDAFEVPQQWTPVGAITVGYPASEDPAPEDPAHKSPHAGSPTRRRRKTTADVVHRGHWRN